MDYKTLATTHITNSAKQRLLPLLNKIEYYNEALTHDGASCDGFDSNIYDLYVITNNFNNTWTYYHYHMEDWFDKTKVHYELYTDPYTLNRFDINFFKTL
jgi:hypothetical protein